MDSPALSVVFPAYNEEARIGTALERTLTFLTDRQLVAEVIVVNDGSIDATEQRAHEFAARDARVRVISSSANRGKGFAVKRGILEARGTYRVFLDVDLSTPIEAVDEMLLVLEDHADIVIGSRHLPDSVIEVPQGGLRRLMGWVFRRITHAVLRLGVSDVTCGFKGIRAATAESVFAVQEEHGWAFDAELIYVSRKWGLDLRELPVRWRDSGSSRVRPLGVAWQSFMALVRVRQHDRRGAYARPQHGVQA